MPLWFESNDCTATRCSLRRGQVFTGRAAVNPSRAFSTLLVELKATLFGIPFPLSIPAGYENACNFLEAGATCPVQAGTEYVWGLQFPIDASYPAAAGVVITSKFPFPFSVNLKVSTANVCYSRSRRRRWPSRLRRCRCRHCLGKLIHTLETSQIKFARPPRGGLLLLKKFPVYLILSRCS